MHPAFLPRELGHWRRHVCTMRPTQHLLEAVHLNKARKKLYRQNFGAKAAKVFAEVMLYEHLMLPFALILDWQAKPSCVRGKYFEKMILFLSA